MKASFTKPDECIFPLHTRDRQNGQNDVCETSTRHLLVCYVCTVLARKRNPTHRWQPQEAVYTVIRVCFKPASITLLSQTVQLTSILM
uniref:Ovule protein n=1 Tax=Ascaris lumbricoides TaxID=6252 RepID=A0A0M3HY55_ASCLU